MIAGGDGADVPDNGPLGVEVGGADEQIAALGVLGGDLAQQTGRDILRDGGGQRRGIDSGNTVEDARQTLADD